MDPITAILWLWLSWGVTSMLLRGHSTTTTEPADNHTSDAGPAADSTGDDDATSDERARWERIRDRVDAWIDQADSSTDQAARSRDWGSGGWWLRAFLGAVWTPIRDIRSGSRWVHDKIKPAQPESSDSTGDAGADPSENSDDPRQPGPGPHTGADDTPSGPRRSERDTSTPPPGPKQAAVEINVEVVGTQPTTPPPPALAPPIPALTAPTPEQDPQPPATAVVDRTEPQQEGNQDMAGNYVAVPGGSGKPATAVAAGITPTTGNGDTHADAKDFAKKIITAMEMTADPVARAEQMLAISLKAAWQAVDRLQEAGVGGPVLERWCEAVTSFGIAHQTAQTLLQQVQEAREDAAAAGRLQARVGDRVQSAVEAAGKSVANHTSYYGKR